MPVHWCNNSQSDTPTSFKIKNNLQFTIFSIIQLTTKPKHATYIRKENYQRFVVLLTVARLLNSTTTTTKYIILFFTIAKIQNSMFPMRNTGPQFMIRIRAFGVRTNRMNFSMIGIPIGIILHTTYTHVDMAWTTLPPFCKL